MAGNDLDYAFLLNEYRKLWNHRILNPGTRSNEETLTEGIKRELKDQNSHPRVRKDLFVKYYYAVNKIINSSLSTESKLLLIQLHNEQMEELNEENRVEKS